MGGAIVKDRPTYKNTIITFTFWGFTQPECMLKNAFTKL